MNLLTAYRGVLMLAQAEHLSQSFLAFTTLPEEIVSYNILYLTRVALF
jgi:hypothetical protein